MMEEGRLSTGYRRDNHSVWEVGELPTNLTRAFAKLGPLTSPVIEGRS
jgi:hypothetical protein